MAIPCERHEGVRENKEEDRKKWLHKNILGGNPTVQKYAYLDSIEI
jgi:hypothetical protein